MLLIQICNLLKDRPSSLEEITCIMLNYPFIPITIKERKDSMATSDFLAEEDVTTANLALIFKRAFFKASESEGDLRVETDGPVTYLGVDQERKLIKYSTIYRLTNDASRAEKIELANKANDCVIVVRCSIPENNDDLLFIDYFLPFEEGIPMYLVVSTLRLFARVIPYALRKSGLNELLPS